LTTTFPNLLSSETVPPRNVNVFLTVFEKSSACAVAAATRAIAIAAAYVLLICHMGILPHHVLQRPLLLHVHRQELLAHMRIHPVLLDFPLALGDRVVQEHQFFLVTD